MRVLIVVTHLLGTGHLARARLLAQAFVRSGHQALVVSGGLPVAHLSAPEGEQRQLPPLFSDGVNFTRLLGAEGTVADPCYLAQRRALLLDTLSDFRPDCLVTELFPFGRRALRDEFTALLEAASAMHPRPLIISSVRDILAPPSKPERIAETDALVAHYYDAVLVHSDPAQIPLEASWPVSDELRAKLRYTGFIAPHQDTRSDTPVDFSRIVVSAGGGDVGGALFDSAVQAAAASPDLSWHLLVGGRNAQDEVARLWALAEVAFDGTRNAIGTRIIIEPARPDFRSLLCAAAGSVSMCGYNTALDLLSTGTPGVFVPFDAGGEEEQGIRARRLARADHFEVVPAHELDARALINALRTVLSAGRFTPDLRMLNGAQRSLAICEAMYREA